MPLDTAVGLRWAVRIVATRAALRTVAGAIFDIDVRDAVGRGAAGTDVLRAVTDCFFVSVVPRDAFVVIVPLRLPTLRSRRELLACGVMFVERETVLSL
jgi:hypothetical protein